MKQNGREAEVLRRDELVMQARLCRLVEKFEILSDRSRREGLVAFKLETIDLFAPEFSDTIAKGCQSIVSGFDDKFIKKRLQKEQAYQTIYAEAAMRGFMAIQVGKETAEVRSAVINAIPYPLQKIIIRSLAALRKPNKLEEYIVDQTLQEMRARTEYADESGKPLLSMTRQETADAPGKADKRDGEPITGGRGAEYAKYAEAAARGHNALLNQYSGNTRGAN